MFQIVAWIGLGDIIQGARHNQFDMAVWYAKRKMNHRQRLLLIVSGLALIALMAFISSACWQWKKPLFQNGPKLVAALHAFSRDEIQHGRALPLEISLGDLVSRGYLSTNDVISFGTMEVIFYTKQEENQPQSVLASVDSGKEECTCLLADGSVQQISRKRLQEYRLRLGKANSPQ